MAAKAPRLVHTVVADAPPRVLVLDTNIALDALVFADPGVAALPALLASGRLRWIGTEAMRAELARVLGYPQIVPRLAYYRLDAPEVLARWDAQVQRVAAAPRIAFVCKDADDQHFLDLAAAHGALLLSKDKAVLCMRKRLQRMGADIATAVQADVVEATAPAAT
ncbi:PIN domain-containing protein [Acidovorax lacteus]|uniref:PIN domain-containing protein n=1 Tax=Acidovorax lacteus TaxID=1924988 RepID=A0ABP8LB51_9BURK